MSSEPARAHGMPELLAIMRRLRDREHGCPWDIEQSFRTIAPYTIEEAYEVADAIERDSMPALREELGDLLFQVVFHAQMAAEAESFTFEDVVDGLCRKMIERHPHVFGEAEARNAVEQTHAWEAMKAEKRAQAGGGVLADVAKSLPALMRAEKLTKRAARVGFDWPTPDAVLEKLDEEMGELAAARAANDAANVEEEIGDILFVLANLARKLGVDPEVALRGANAKFERRFGHMESALGGKLDGRSLEELEALWDAAKAAERGA